MNTSARVSKQTKIDFHDIDFEI